mmetsp:Transcript_10757/g.12988  ORF Transcript_10757/g.12988 Transcript_10757/m.12988 type:complete len:210 (+) Transcript_10757:105-734(+)
MEVRVFSYHKANQTLEIVQREKPAGKGKASVVQTFVEPGLRSGKESSWLAVILSLESATLFVLMLIAATFYDALKSTFAFLLISILYAYAKFGNNSSIIIEEVVVLPGIGVQLAQKRRNGSKIEAFIDICDINSMVICEEVTAFGVHCFLALAMKHRQEDTPETIGTIDRLVDCFPATRPGLGVLRSVYQRSNQLLAFREIKEEGSDVE